jgi:fatty acid desaturase
MRCALGNFASRYCSIFRHADGVLPNTLALGYALGGHLLALVLLGMGGWWFVPGVILLASSLVIAAFLIHECTHQTLFPSLKAGGPDRHTHLATVLAWLVGACYGDYQRIRDKHLRHHFERADIVALDYRDLLGRHPLLKRAVEVGQWLGLPAVELLFHGLVLARPFHTGDLGGQRRVLAVVALRGLYFFALFSLGGWSLLLGYCLAYLLFLTVMGFMDAFQHQYLLLVGLEGSRGQSPTQDRSRFPRGYFSREYEEARTFTNPISVRFPALNLLVLNFCHHNVHHQRPAEPWHRLPALERQLYPAGLGAPRVVPFARQVGDFYRYRVARVMAPAGDTLDSGGDPSVGAAGVSFLTAL